VKNFKTSTKVLAGFGIPVIFILAVGLIGIFNLYSLNKRYVDAINKESGVSVGSGSILAAEAEENAHTSAAIVTVVALIAGA